MPSWKDDMQGIRGEIPGVDPGRNIDGHTQTHIGAIIETGPDDLAGVRLMQRYPHMRKASPERGQLLRQKTDDCRHIGVEANRSPHLFAMLLYLPDQALQLIVDLQAALENDAARIGQGHAPRGADQQGGSERMFKIGNPAAQGR